MKVTFILGATDITGGYRAVFEIANRLTKKGHEIYLIHPLIPIVIKPFYKIQDIIRIAKGTICNVIRGSKIGWFNIDAYNMRVLSIYSYLDSLILSKIPDSDIIIATAWETAYFIKNLPGKKGNKAYFIQHYEIWDMWNEKKCWDDAEKILGNWNDLHLAMSNVVPDKNEARRIKEIIDATYKFPFVQITTASWLMRLMKNKFKQKAKQIILGVNFTDFDCSPPKNDSNKLTVLMPFRNKIWKGDSDGIEALKMVKKEYPDINIITYGSIHNNIKEASLDIKNYGIVFGDKLKRLYCLADIFVYPSWVEGWGLPQMEAMACGTACVTTNVGGVLDYSIPGLTSIVIPPRQPKKLAEAIILLLKDEYKRNKIAAAGYNYIKQFTWNQATQQIESIFKEMLRI
jgi:glycosyltransferase involved in cell wall biosynthesis